MPSSSKASASAAMSMRAREVQPAEAREAGEALLVEDAGALVPDVHVEPAGVLLGPLVEMQPPERVLVGRDLLGLLRLGPEVVGPDRDPIAGVRLAPGRDLAPVVGVERLVDDREELVVAHGAVAHLAGVVPDLVTDRVPVVARGGDRDRERLPPRAGRRVEHVPELAVRLRVQLVEDDPVRVQPVLGVGVRREHAVHRGGRFDDDRLAVDLAAARERRRPLDHLLRGAEDDVGLVGVGGRRVDLGAGLEVGEQQLDADAGADGRLRVLARHCDQRLPVAPRSVGALPAEERPDELAVCPRLQLERLARVLALDVPQVAREEPAGEVGRLLVEPELSRRTSRRPGLRCHPVSPRRCASASSASCRIRRGTPACA